MKILLRSHMLLDGSLSMGNIIYNNYIGSNIGNILFANSMNKWLMQDGVEITRIDMSKPFSEKQIAEYNEQYNMFVLPLANAFRADFMKELKNITKFVNKLTIPCVVIGTGIQREIQDNSWDFEFNDTVKDFMKAVLKKSAMIGVRGEMTADYLRYLGYTQEKDFTVIGCPSLFTYGYDLPKPEVRELTPQSNISFNMTLLKSLFLFLMKQADQFAYKDYIATLNNELKYLYAGVPYPAADVKRIVPKGFPISMDTPLIRDNRVVSFVDSNSWINFLKTKDFSFGCRIHGSIANVLAGTPVYIFARDDRVAELATYHNIPFMNHTDITDDTNIFKLHEKADFTKILDGHRERVDYFVEFLDLNKVPHLAPEAMSQETQFDRYYKGQYYFGEIRSLFHQTPQEQERRLADYYDIIERKRSWFANTVTEKDKQLKEKDEKIKELKASAGQQQKKSTFFDKLKNKLS